MPKTDSLALMLVYEPATDKGQPMPIARVTDRDLTCRVACSAIAEAEDRADALEATDDTLGLVGRADAERLKQVLRVLMPSLSPEVVTRRA